MVSGVVLAGLVAASCSSSSDVAEVESNTDPEATVAPDSTPAPNTVDGPTPITPPDPTGLPSISEPDPAIVIGELDNGLRYLIRDNDNPGGTRRHATGRRRRIRTRGRHPSGRGALPRTHAVQRHRTVPRERTDRRVAQLRRRLRCRHQRVHELRRDRLRTDHADRRRHRGRDRTRRPPAVAVGCHDRTGPGRGRARCGARRVAGFGGEFGWPDLRRPRGALPHRVAVRGARSDR